jgi:Cobalamin synthesis protein cobW C-terminal domain
LYVVQAVHDLWEIHPASDDLQWDRPLDGQDTLPVRTCKLVLIGRFLQEDGLRTGFNSCFLDSNE